MSSVPTIQTTSESEWLSKADAAAFLNVSPRQIERRAAQGYVETRRLPRRPTERSERVEYSLADLAAIREGRPNQHGIPEPAGDNAAGDPPEPVAKSTALARRGLEFDWKAIEGLLAPRPPKPWLTLDEAVMFSGLPKGWLMREARKGSPLALNVGSAKRASFRFSRELLSGRLT
jgi:hypothetical protein